MDDTLKKADAPQILEELLPAQNRAKLLGVKLGLPDHEVEAIILRYPDARDRLYHIIIEFLRQVEPRPTWRVMVEALRSPGVGLPDLAKKLEEAHFPDSTATRHEPVGKWSHHLHSRLTGVATSHVSIISDTESAANTTATGDDDDEVKSKTSSQQDSPVSTSHSLMYSRSVLSSIISQIAIIFIRMVSLLPCRFEQLPGPERARRVRESLFELAGSRPPLVDPSPLYSGMVKFGDALFTLEDAIANTVESLKKSEKIKEVPAAIDAFRAIRRVGHQALTVVEKFNDIFHHVRKTKRAREALINHDDAGPLRELLDTVKNCIDNAKKEYKTFERIYREASNACSAAGQRCKEETDSVGTIKETTGAIGITASATAIGIGVIGFFTGGIPLGIVLGAAGIGGFYLTSKLVEYYREAEIIFADVSNLFNEELLNSVSKIKGNVDEVRRRVSTVETDIELYEADREATCRALDNQHVVFSRFYEETLSHVTSLRRKVRELDDTIDQFLA